VQSLAPECPKSIDKINENNFHFFPPMDYLKVATRSVADFISGIPRDNSVEDDDGDSKVQDQAVYLVTYGSFDPLPSFDPECLALIVLFGENTGIS